MKRLTEKHILQMHSLLIQETGGSEVLCTDEQLIELGLGLASGRINYEELLNWIIEKT